MPGVSGNKKLLSASGAGVCSNILVIVRIITNGTGIPQDAAVFNYGFAGGVVDTGGIHTVKHAGVVMVGGKPVPIAVTANKHRVPTSVRNKVRVHSSQGAYNRLPITIGNRCCQFSFSCTFPAAFNFRVQRALHLQRLKITVHVGQTRRIKGAAAHGIHWQR